MSDIWQDYDCPTSGIDFDIEEILAVGEQCYCSGCGQHHTVGQDIEVQTYIRKADGELEFRGAPKDAAEKAAWKADLSRCAN